MENLTIERRYGIWKEPTVQDSKGRSREVACANYRDFNNLITERSVGSVRRGVYLMDVASKAARFGAVGFSVACKDFKGEQCDGLALLRSVDLRKIRSVELGTETLGAKSTQRVDHIEVLVSEDHLGDWLRFTIRSVQEYGRHNADEGEVVAVEINGWRWD